MVHTKLNLVHDQKFIRVCILLVDHVLTKEAAAYINLYCLSISLQYLLNLFGISSVRLMQILDVDLLPWRTRPPPTPRRQVLVGWPCEPHQQRMLHSLWLMHTKKGWRRPGWSIVPARNEFSINIKINNQ